jgi:imidazolonepropionase-like amidohydrolase
VASANLLQLHQAGVPIALGTDAGNPMVLHGPSAYAELEAMQAVGLLPMDVLVAATRNGARAMGREQDLGTVEAGKVADLLVLDADPSADIANFRKLRQVIRAGVVHDRSDLLPDR